MTETAPAVLLSDLTGGNPDDPSIAIINIELESARGILTVQAEDDDALRALLDVLIFKIGGEPNDILRPLLLAEAGLHKPN